MSTGAGKSLRVRRSRSHSLRRSSTTGSMTRKSTSLSALASPRAWEPKRITFDSAPAVSASSFPAWSIRLRETMADKVAEQSADNAIHWAAERSRCPNRNRTTAIDWNRSLREAPRRPLRRAENAHSSDSLRRESLYPAELSGLGYSNRRANCLWHRGPLGLRDRGFFRRLASWPSGLQLSRPRL